MASASSSSRAFRRPRHLLKKYHCLCYLWLPQNVEGSQIHIWPFFRGAFLCAPLFLSPPFLRKLHTSHRAKFQSPFTRFPAQFSAHPMSLNQLLPHLIFASVTKINCHKNLRRERSKQQPAVRLLAVKLRAFLWITSDFQTINLIVASTLPPSHSQRNIMVWCHISLRVMCTAGLETP